ncbi:MAG: exodeoxyribonuclease VII large subunit [Chlamydiales bacterium]
MNGLKTEIPLLTVSQLTQAIKLNLETMFPNIYLQGEISNLKVQSSGHVYFSLKDTNAQISSVMFKTETTFLKRLPKDGDHVMVKGEINVYPPKGNYQLIIRELSFMGIGELLQKLEQLKVKLHKMGWFKAARKKALPRLPQRIGVVTSPTGAVIQDILHILSRRFSGFHLILNPVKVQGEGAAEEIAKAIAQFNEHDLADVLIVGRGGGSLEDLWAFNEEIVAEAIYNSRIPIISAVGHETDHCIADYVADVRAPTPSAAAEIVIAEKNQLLDYLQGLKKRMQQTIGHLIQKDRYRLKGIALHPLLVNPHSLVEWRMQRLDDFKTEIHRSLQQQLQLKKQALLARSRQAIALKPTNQIAHFKQRLHDRDQALRQVMQKKLHNQRQWLNQCTMHLKQTWQTQQTQRRYLLDKERLIKRLDQLVMDRYLFDRQKLLNVEKLLKAFDPKNVLNKGYSLLLEEKTAAVIHSIHQVKKGQQSRLLLSDGELHIMINEIKSSKP